MTPAQKAVRTRNARKVFLATYGKTTTEVVRGFETGQDDYTIMWNAGVDEHQLAAYKANYSRGTYDNHLLNCNF